MNRNVSFKLTEVKNESRRNLFEKQSSEKKACARTALASLSCNVPSLNSKCSIQHKTSFLLSNSNNKSKTNTTSTPKVAPKEQLSTTLNPPESILRKGLKISTRTFKSKTPLTHAGNKRQRQLVYSPNISKTIVKEKSKPAKSSAEQEINIQTRKQPDGTFLTTSYLGSTLILDEPTRKSVMGYDWIAGLLDTDSSMVEKTEHNYQELKEFRNINKEECFRPLPKFNMSIPLNSTIHDQYLQQQCSSTEISNENANENAYVLNHRLQPVPLHGILQRSETREGSERYTKDNYIRVTVPRSALKSPYRIKPHRLTSFDSSDSVALSEHCLSGWQCSIRSFAPARKNIDLKSNIEEKHSTVPSLFQSLKEPPSRITRKLLRDSKLHKL